MLPKTRGKRAGTCRCNCRTLPTSALSRPGGNPPAACDAGSEGQRALLDRLEAGLEHRAAKPVAVEEGLDRARQVPIGAGRIACDQRGGPRHDPVRVEAVRRADQAVARLVELEDDEPPSRTKDAPELAERLHGVADIAQAKRDRHDIRAAIRKRERRRIALLVAHLGALPGATPALDAGDVEHLRREVDADDAARAGGREQLREVARSARHIDDIVGGLGRGKPDRCAPPGLVEPERVQAVVQVVGARDGREHGLHLGSLVTATVRVLREFVILPNSIGHGAASIGLHAQPRVGYIPSGMIVDLDMRLWLRSEELGDELAASVRRATASRWLQPDASPTALDAQLATVDGGVVVGFRSELLRGAVSESAVLAAAERSAGRLVAARAVDPMGKDAERSVESARADGFRAIWVDPCLQGFHPSDTRAMRVFDRCEAMQLPILVGWSGPLPASARLEFARPYLLDEVARAFPRLSIVLGGFGVPFIGETLAMLAKHDRVFTHTGGIAARPWELLHALQSCRDHGVDQKVFFASGFPFDTPARAVEAIYSINAMVQSTPLPIVARSVLREIVERDAMSLLGMGAPPARAERQPMRALAAGLRVGEAESFPKAP